MRWVRLFLAVGKSSSIVSRRNMSVPSSSSSSSSHSVWKTYCDLLESNPLPTKLITSGVISFSGDLLSQTLFSQEAFDISRCIRYTTAGTLLVGPTLHYWYRYLNRVIPGTSLVVNLKRLIFDQLLFSPCFTCVFICSLSIIGEGKSFIDTVRKLEQDFVKIVFNGWIIWCPAQFINFTFIPSKFQVLYSNGIGLLWNTYLSHASTRKVKNVNFKNEEQELPQVEGSTSK